MSFLGDTFLGSRPDMTLPPWFIDYLDNIRGAANVGRSRVEKYARKDLRAAKEGRIEDMIRLKPVLSAINANKASSYRTADREMGKALAFSDDPSLHAAMLGEVSGNLDENAANAFAGAASDAYSSAANDLTSERRWRLGMKYAGELARGQLAASTMYDRSRRGGIASDIIKGWFNPGAWTGLAGAFGGGSSGGGGGGS